MPNLASVWCATANWYTWEDCTFLGRRERQYTGEENEGGRGKGLGKEKGEQGFDRARKKLIKWLI